MRESRVYRDLAKGVAGVGPLAKYRLTRQTIMCSATIPQRQHFASTCFQKGWTATLPELVNFSKNELVPAQVAHWHVPCEPELRQACMAYLLRSKLKTALVKRAEAEALEVEGVEGVEGEVEVVVGVDGVMGVKGVKKERAEVAEGAEGAEGAEEEEEEEEEDGEVEAREESNPLFQAIIFVDAKHEKDIDTYIVTAQSALLKALQTAGSTEVPVVGALLESMDIDERGRVLERYRQAKCGALVCSDLAARGLDIPNTSLVVQMSLPSRVEDYLHRAGRTGRMNRGKGNAGI
jgi:superfamily II DNA/RNA helicase